MALFTSPPSVGLPNIIIYPTRANIVLFQRDRKCAGDDERTDRSENGLHAPFEAARHRTKNLNVPCHYLPSQRAVALIWRILIENIVKDFSYLWRGIDNANSFVCRDPISLDGRCQQST